MAFILPWPLTLVLAMRLTLAGWGCYQTQQPRASDMQVQWDLLSHSGDPGTTVSSSEPQIQTHGTDHMPWRLLGQVGFVTCGPTGSQTAA